MKYILLLFLLNTVSVFALESSKEVERINFSIVSDKKDKTISEEIAILEINLVDFRGLMGFDLRYGIDNIEDTIHIDSLQFSLEIPAGSHQLDFYISSEYYEVSTHLIDFKPSHRMIANVHFRSATQQILMRKPIIYLYPEEKKQVNVSVHPEGEFTFTYPEYQDGWQVTADPTGQLHHQNNTYNYLFWEADQATDLSFLPKDRGFVISGDSVVPFLEEKLDSFGFTAKEKSDFITYWAPSMRKNSNLYICFMFNEACNVFATLDIRPQPDEVARFYMLWKPIVGDGSKLNIVPQRIPKMSRTGFTVLEWGGAKLTSD